VTPTTAPRS
jgi:hypothetical protein